MIHYKLKTEPTQREITLLNALRDLQAIYCDTIQKHEPETDIFKDAGYLNSQQVIKQFYVSERA